MKQLYFPNWWQPMETAPRDCTWVELLVQSREDKSLQFIQRAHWASDLSGEDQPPFEGWFQEYPGCSGYFEVVGIKLGWRPENRNA